MNSKYFIHVLDSILQPLPLLPHSDTSNTTQITNKTSNILLVNEYGKNDSLKDLKIQLEIFGQVKVHPITLSNMNNTIQNIMQIIQNHQEFIHIIFNLCDGLEFDGYCGLSVVKLLEKNQLAFTGSNSSFFHSTTSKPFLKQLLIQNNVSTSQFIVIDRENIDKSIKQAELSIG